MNDDLDRLLAAPNSATSPERRDQLRIETSRRIRRYRWRRWSRSVAALAACYFAGAVTADLWRPAPTVEIVERIREVPAAPVPPGESSPAALELAAELADPADGARLFLEAGRRYGRDWNDWTSAVRCYRNALDLLGTTPPPDPADDWLLTRLKIERRETLVHTNP